MLNKLLSMIRTYDLIQPGDTVICALSGGADSVALLFGLYLLKEKLGFALQAAHFNHHLRGEESNQDEAFVRELCNRYEIPLTVGEGMVIPGKKGIEAAAREARYAFLEALPGKIATAHTANDNAETVLMHMVRGTGLKGLGAIAPVRGLVIRPMLSVTREQVLAFLEEYHVPFVEDSSNASDQFLRNRLRHYVMPLLKKENPKIAENLSAMALRLREDEQALSEMMDFSQGLDIEIVKQMPTARSSRVLKAFLEYCGVKEPDAGHISMAQALVNSINPSAIASFPGGVTICRQYGRMVRQEVPGEALYLELTCPGAFVLSDLGLYVRCFPADTLVNTNEIFTVEAVGTMVLRSRQAGDTVRLSGGSKTLKKIFIDKKIPATQRHKIPVLSDAVGVLGVYGIGANRDRIPNSLPAVQVCFEKLPIMKRENI